jgi:predicted AlkP superfamily phosphohydrolase/phosphomutase
MLDWDHTTAFAATPTSNGVYIVVDRDGSGVGVPPAGYEAFLKRLVQELTDARHPQTGEPITSEVWSRDEAFAGPYGDMAPDITLTMPDGGLVSILNSQAIVAQRPSVAGAHRPVGVFGARGPRICAGLDAGELSILDVAPLILYSLDLPIPEDIQGHMPEELFDKAHLEQAPMKTDVRKAPVPEPAVPASQMSKQDEQIVLDRLRELGYVE